MSLTPREVVPNDYEKKIIAFARQALLDIPECAAADYSVRWSRHASGDVFPFLVLAFHLPNTVHQPALGMSLVTVRKGTLFEVLPGKMLYEGDKLRGHIRRSVEDYLKNHGIKIHVS